MGAVGIGKEEEKGRGKERREGENKGEIIKYFIYTLSHEEMLKQS